MRALEEDTSVNSVLREYLEHCSEVRQERREAWAGIRDIAARSGMSSEGKGLPKREELYDRKIMRNRGTGP